jgi:hypothetical protein
VYRVPETAGTRVDVMPGIRIPSVPLAVVVTLAYERPE